MVVVRNKWYDDIVMCFIFVCSNAFLGAVINFLITNYKVMKIIFTKSAMLSPNLWRGFYAFMVLKVYLHILPYFIFKKWIWKKSYKILDNILYPDLV